MNAAKKLLLISSLTMVVSSIAFSKVTEASSLEEANKLYTSGATQAGEQIYAQLLAENKTEKYLIHINKALAHINRLEFTTSDKEYALFVAALANNPNKADILAEFDYKRSALLINKGEPRRALAILENYVFLANPNVRMQSDYLDALARLGEDTALINAAQRFWRNDYQNVPNYGVLLVADSLFKLKKYSQAEQIYTLMLTRDSNHLYANLSLAYCLAMRNQQQTALEIYKKCSTLKDSSEDILLVEAELLFNNGKRQLANQLFAFLQSKSAHPAKVHLAKAKALSSSGYYLASSKELAYIDTAHHSPEYLALEFSNKIDTELYHDASKALAALQNTALHKQLSQRYRQARRGGMDTVFVTTSNYKGNSSQTYRLEGDTYLGLNTYLTAALDSTRLSDSVHLATVATSTLGLVHRFERGKIHAALTNAVSGSAHTLYKAGLSFKIDDLTTVSFDFGKRYVGDSKAVLNSFITENHRSLALARRFNEKNILFAEYTTASLTDNNHYYAYSFSHSYFPVKDEQKNHELYAYYRRSGFGKPSSYYESPDKRIAYGVGWQARWFQTTRAYWTLRFSLELGHDNLEPTDLSPAIRVQYTHPLAKHQELSLAVEYGLHTNKINNINYFMHGYKQFEIKYHLSW